MWSHQCFYRSDILICADKLTFMYVYDSHKSEFCDSTLLLKPYVSNHLISSSMSLFLLPFFSPPPLVSPSQCLFLSLDDHSRVILQPIEDDPSSDYINANYIDVSGNASNATIGSQRNQRNHTPSLVCQASILLLRLPSKSSITPWDQKHPSVSFSAVSFSSCPSYVCVCEFTSQAASWAHVHVHCRSPLWNCQFQEQCCFFPVVWA